MSVRRRHTYRLSLRKDKARRARQGDEQLAHELCRPDRLDVVQRFLRLLKTKTRRKTRIALESFQ